MVVRATSEVDPKTCFPLAEAAPYFPRKNGKRISLATLYRWATHGVRGSRLTTIRLGGQQVCTSEVWVREFIASLNSTKQEALAGIRPVELELIRRQQIDLALDHAGI